VTFEERCGLVEQHAETALARASCLLPRRALLVFEGDAEPVGEPFDRPDEVQVLDLPDEADGVAAAPAAEAVVETVRCVDREARRLLLVERTASRVARALLAKGRVLGDDVDDVGALLDVLDRAVLDSRLVPYSAAAYASAKRSVIPAT
jgi:hypothetical protein